MNVEHIQNWDQFLNIYIIFNYLKVQVIEDDKVNRSGQFQTTSRGSVPPLVTTDFITQDQGKYIPDTVPVLIIYRLLLSNHLSS
jgi:hypothetical protein